MQGRKHKLTSFLYLRLFGNKKVCIIIQELTKELNMREPNCTRIVPSKNLWELAIDFMSNVDEKLRILFRARKSKNNIYELIKKYIH